MYRGSLSLPLHFHSKDPLTDYFRCLIPPYKSQTLTQTYPTSHILFYSPLFPLCNEEFSFLVLYHKLNKNLFTFWFFFTVCKILSHYTRCLKIESISCLRHLQYKLTHCKDHCWVFLNHMAFTTSAKRQTSMHWHCLSICLLYCHDSSEPNLDANFLLTICLQESSQASWWLGASQDRADANLW